MQMQNVRAMVSEAEWEARVELAAAYRLIAHYGMSDMIYNHITTAVPGSHDEFLINPFGLLYEEINASCLIKINLAAACSLPQRYQCSSRCSSDQLCW
ncbi:class II aldolase/adducin family protein [Pseudomonas helleri]|uniref:class II aldolase/adducin family protein n=1 Tax=Pseudomonas helleri TaxID=1608996 RepID=UPI00333EC907